MGTRGRHLQILNVVTFKEIFALIAWQIRDKLSYALWCVYILYALFLSRPLFPFLAADPFARPVLKGKVTNNCLSCPTLSVEKVSLVRFFALSLLPADPRAMVKATVVAGCFQCRPIAIAGAGVAFKRWEKQDSPYFLENCSGRCCQGIVEIVIEKHLYQVLGDQISDGQFCG